MDATTIASLRCSLERIRRAIDGTKCDLNDANDVLQELFTLLDSADPIIARAAQEALEQQLSTTTSELFKRTTWLRHLTPQNGNDLSCSNSYVRIQLLRNWFARAQDLVQDSSPLSCNLGSHSMVLIGAIRGISVFSSHSDLVKSEAFGLAASVIGFARTSTSQKNKLLDSVSFLAFMDQNLETPDGWISSCIISEFLLLAFLQMLSEFLRLLMVDVRHPQSTRQLQKLLLWLNQSSLSTQACRLTASPRPPNTNNGCSLVSATSSFPVAQVWILWTLQLVLGVVKSTDDKLLEQLDRVFCSKHLLLPRCQMLEFLLEVDDILVDAMMLVVEISEASENSESNGSADNHFLTELNPCLLFCDMLDCLSGDHLVLLDWMTSLETNAIAFMLRFLRHLSKNWLSCSSTLSRGGKLELVVSTLNQLRADIDKLARQGVFPYNPRLLLQRLGDINDHYRRELGNDNSSD